MILPLYDITSILPLDNITSILTLNTCLAELFLIITVCTFRCKLKTRLSTCIIESNTMPSKINFNALEVKITRIADFHTIKQSSYMYIKLQEQFAT